MSFEFSARVWKRLTSLGQNLIGIYLPPIKASARCERRHIEYALHHKVRRLNPKIVEMEQKVSDIA